VRLGVKLEGRRNFEGLLAGVEGDRLRLEVDGAVRELPWP
jgi:ribosome maturation factor RimP